MPWIYFERDEPAAPSIRLSTLDSHRLEPADFRGISGLVLFFAHGLDCPACYKLVSSLAQTVGTLRVQGAEVLVILPQAEGYPAPDLGALHLLLDHQGALRRAYAAILEFDLASQPLLFILNQFNAPFRAWTGDEPDPEILPQILKYLESAALLCPE